MKRVLGAALTMILLGATVVPPERAAGAITLPSGFQEQIVFTGLDHPTNVEFAPDGRVFVAEKRGVIKVFDNLADPTASVYADLSVNVHNTWDRGLLGMALDPQFPSQPYIYVLYTYDAPPGVAAPYWHDVCPSAIGGDNGGNCVVTGRLSRLDASGAETVLVSGWCQQFPSHSIGDLQFGVDGMLYASSGDGASFNNVDYGQFGTPSNPCGDPAGEGGAVRSQDVGSDGDPAGLNGTVLRLDPVTGLAAAGNPFATSPDLNKRRVVGYGLRNPYHFTMRPGTNEAWLGDVGWGVWEEIDRLADPLALSPENFGWPCYEGPGRNTSYDNANLALCESLYPVGHKTPFFTYNHSSDIVPSEGCYVGGDAITGLAFYPYGGTAYPAEYKGALFFADFSRGCIWAMQTAAPGGLPSPASTVAFARNAAYPVDLAVGPGDELYYVDHGGTIRRIRYFPSNQPPIAVINASPVQGHAPLAVHFDASASTDYDPADQDHLTYQWDFTNDGSFDATGPITDYVYPENATYTVRLRVTDTLDAFTDATEVIHADGFAPIPVIDTPSSGSTWAVGDEVSFQGHAVDPDTGQNVPDSALSWQLRLQHCETVNQCHTHVVGDSWQGVAQGTFTAPDHDVPAYLELVLTASDGSQTSSAVRRLDPQTVTLGFNSKPEGITVSAGSYAGNPPFSIEVIKGSTRTVSAPSTYVLNGSTYFFFTWSDYGKQTHVIQANQSRQYRATYLVCGGWTRFLRPAVCSVKSPTPRRYLGTRPFA